MLFFLYAALFFGLVILIHEAGHFITAKLFGVKVITFSIGFGKSLVSWKRGETEYRISFIPLGGYVRMYGENPDRSDIEPDMEDRAFTCKPWWQKALIALAGPLCNIVLAVLLLFIVSFFKYTDVAPVVEYITPDSPAAASSLREGDTITGLGNTDVYVWEDIKKAMPDPVDGTCPAVDVRFRSWGSDAEKTISLSPEFHEFRNAMKEPVQKCMFGIAAIPRDTRIALTAPVKGLRNGDTVTAVNEHPVSRFHEIRRHLKNNTNTITVRREDTPVSVTLSQNMSQTLENALVHGGMLIDSVKNNSVAAELGVKKNDLIHTVGGERIHAPFDFKKELHRLKKGDTVPITFFRNGNEHHTVLSLDFSHEENKYTGMKQKKLRWGADFLFDYSLSAHTAQRHNPLFYTFSFGLRETVRITELTFKGFWYIISGKVSARSIGGPILVFDISRKAAEKGVRSFLYIIAAISINLAILNLLPIPALDGGHIMMYTIEAAIGREINRKVKEIAIATGFVMLMLLMGFVLTNDILRIIPSLWER